MFNNVLKVADATKDLNDITYTDYFYRLMLLARSVFRWEGLPNGIDSKWIEKYLFTEGKCMFFKDKDKGFMIAKMTPAGELNYYDEPTLIRPYGTNYTGALYENNVDAVVIKNNDEMIPTSPTIQLYALRLADIQRAIDININAQKTPVLIKCSEKQRLTLKNVYKQWNGFEPVIFGDKDLEVDSMKVLNTDAPVVFEKLQYQKHTLWNECMTFIGINNANIDKRERLVESEVLANNEQIILSAYTMLKTRERACELINKMFPELNVSVKMCDCNEIKGVDEDDTSKVHSGIEDVNR